MDRPFFEALKKIMKKFVATKLEGLSKFQIHKPNVRGFVIFYRIILSFVDISARTTMHKLVLTHIRYLKIDVVTLVYMYVQAYSS